MKDLQVFVFDKTCHLFLRNSALVHPESASSVHPRVHFFKVYFFVSCFPTMSSNRTKLKHGTMNLKSYGLSLVQYVPSDQRVLFQCILRVRSQCTLGCTSYGVINENCFQRNPLQGTKLKYVAMQLNTFVNFIQNFESDVI